MDYKIIPRPNQKPIEMEEYKGYVIQPKNEWGMYEAVSLKDCDAAIIYDRTLSGLKVEIDESEKP